MNKKPFTVRHLDKWWPENYVKTRNTQRKTEYTNTFKTSKVFKTNTVYLVTGKNYS